MGFLPILEPAENTWYDAPIPNLFYPSLAFDFSQSDGDSIPLICQGALKWGQLDPTSLIDWKIKQILWGRSWQKEMLLEHVCAMVYFIYSIYILALSNTNQDDGHQGSPTLGSWLTTQSWPIWNQAV